jgi:HD-GYP domain-containing protein (c-di-GMP phosphodiesterase class II)
LDGEFYLYWRAPWVAVYAALISLKSGQGDPLTAFMSGLFADLGLYDVEEAVVREYLFSETRSPLNEQRKSFEAHPILSLNRCLSKGFPINESVKAVLVCTHEQADEKGFPNQVPQAQLPIEAQIVAFAEKIDQGVLTTMKQTGVGFRFLKEKIWEAEKNSGQKFSESFLNSIGDSLI